MKHFLHLLMVFFSAAMVAQNTYIAPTEGTLVIDDCSGILYDSGGADDFYSDNDLSTIVINATAGDLLELTFTEFDVESNFDFLTIYDGPDTNSPLVGFYSGTELPNNGAPILLSGSTATITFISDFTINASGFAMGFECVDFTDPPVAAAAFPSISCTGTVAFADASTFFPTSWAWDFGDGGTSTEQNPVHSYANPGTYDIELTVCNDNGCDTFTASEAISYDPESFACTNGFTMTYQGVDTTSLCNGVLYDNGGIDGDYQEGSYDQFIIAPPGATAITLTFSAFDLGDIVNNHDQLYIFAGSGTIFTPLAVYNGNELPNNGQPITFEESSLNVYFTSDHFNNYPGFELIWEANGSTNPPVAAISADATSIPFGTAVQFTDESTENPGGWQWDFGDGNTSNEQNPSHVYNQTGTFDVTLSVTNCNGSDTSVPLQITVQDPPAITYDPDSFTVEIDAGATTTEALNLCNEGLGDLIGDINLTNTGTQVGYVFEFTTTATGAGFGWQLLDFNFEVVRESTQEYFANTTYTEIIDGLEPGGEYYFMVVNAGAGGVIEELSLSDLGTQAIIFEGFFEFAPDQIYFFPPPLEGEGLGVEWLDITENTNPLAPDVCEELIVTFDATDLIDGTYEGSIVIQSNDPNNPIVTIPVTLIVNGTPALTVSANDLDFGEIQVGASSSLSFELENTGTAAVEISGLLSEDPAFTVQSTDDVVLEPNEVRTITVTFTPTAIADFSETLTLANNAGDDVLVNLSGTGIAAPSLTINPTEFTVELITGEDTTLTVDIGNVGEAVLEYNIEPFSNSTGFIFNFTTDTWGSEFSWDLFDDNGQLVQTSVGTFYDSNTEYSVELGGLSSTETYTLRLQDSWGDGALPSYSILDASSGQVIASGAFVGNLSELIVPLGSPSSSFSTITPTSGTLQVNESEELTIDVDATGLSTGVYYLTYIVNTNDPLQPTATITVTLYVIAPVEAAIAVPAFVCGTLPVQFTDESINVPTSWSWDFGDGTTSTAQNPIHTYAESGVYTVSLEACNSLGCDAVILEDYIEVQVDCYSQNIPEHGNEIITVCEGTVYDSGGPEGDYLEGSFGSLTIAPSGATVVSVTFNEFNFAEHDFLYVYDGDLATGTLIGTFTGTELQGQTLTASSGVITLQEYTNHFVNASGFAATFSCEAVQRPPDPAFTLLNDQLCANEAVFFTDESTNGPTEWFWEFGDGATSTEQNPFYSYSEAGTYTVIFTSCNEFGCGTLIQDITIDINTDCLLENMAINSDQVITACEGTLYDSGGADENYLDDNIGRTTIYSNGGPITLDFVAFNMEDAFDFLIVIDGTSPEDDPLLGAFTGSELPPSVTSTGDVITIIEVTDFIISESGYQINYTCAGGNPMARGIMVHNEEICDGKRSFSVDTEMTFDSWSWDFGDGTTSTEANPEHEFATYGAYQIAVTTCLGEDCETMETMIYSNKLTPEIEAPDVVAPGAEVHVHGLTEHATHWNWDFGNGQTSDEHAPITTYTETGWHDIHVHLINMNIHETCDATHVHSILVDENLTSVDGVENLSITVYPNPTKGEVNIKGLEQLSGDYSLRVLSVTGQVVKTQALNETISIAEFPAGMYILEIVDGKETIGRTRMVKE